MSLVPRPNPTPLTVSKEPPAEPVLGVIYTRAGVTLKDCMKGNSKPSGNPSGITTEMSEEVLLLMSLITTEALVVVTAVVSYNFPSIYNLTFAMSPGIKPVPVRVMVCLFVAVS